MIMGNYKHFTVEVENGIVVIKFKGKHDIDKEAAKEVNNDIVSFLNGNDILNAPYMIFPSGKVKVSLRAKNYLRNSECYNRASKIGYVSSSALFSFIFTLYKKMNEEMKMKLFESEFDALLWISIGDVSENFIKKLSA